MVCRSVDGRPDRFSHEQAESLHQKKTQFVTGDEGAWREGSESFGANLDVVVGVQSEAVVNSGRQHNHVALSAIDPDPLLVGVTDVEVP